MCKSTRALIGVLFLAAAGVAVAQQDRRPMQGMEMDRETMRQDAPDAQTKGQGEKGGSMRGGPDMQGMKGMSGQGGCPMCGMMMGMGMNHGGGSMIVGGIVFSLFGLLLLAALALLVVLEVQWVRLWSRRLKRKE